MSNPDAYYQRSEVSNSDLTSLKELLHPRPIFGDREKALKFGTLVDAIITEPLRVDYYQLTVDDEKFSEEDFQRAMEMYRSLRRHARRDPFLDHVLKKSDTQTVMANKGQTFDYGGFEFQLDTRCKWDWWLGTFGGDLKTTFADSQAQFSEAVDFFDWDRSRAWYMDIAGSNRDFIYAISKKNFKVFKLAITRDDPIYRKGREKYEELAFQWWCMNPLLKT